jgi:hypothetical protein
VSTVERRLRTGEALTSEESDRISRVAKVLRRAVEVFGDDASGGGAAKTGGVVVPDQVWDRALWVEEKTLPRTWRAEPAGMGSRQFGDQWITSGKSALLCLPSVIVPEDTNALINPFEPFQERLAVMVVFDERLTPGRVVSALSSSNRSGGGHPGTLRPV